MTRTLGAIGLALGVALTAGCNETASPHTTAWYVAHPQAAHARASTCDGMALHDRDADCLNAASAELDLALHGKPSIKNPYAK